MNAEHWKVLAEGLNRAQAEVLKGLLEAQGLTVYLAQEGAGVALGLTVGPLGEAQIWVPSSQWEQAQQVYRDFLEGRWEAPDEAAEP